MKEAEFRAESPALAPEAPVKCHPAATRRRVYIDCRWFASECKCSLVMAGTEEEVLAAALTHATGPQHGEHDTPDFRDALQQSLREVPKGDSTLA